MEGAPAERGVVRADVAGAECMHARVHAHVDRPNTVVKKTASVLPKLLAPFPMLPPGGMMSGFGPVELEAPVAVPPPPPPAPLLLRSSSDTPVEEEEEEVELSPPMSMSLSLKDPLELSSAAVSLPLLLPLPLAPLMPSSDAVDEPVANAPAVDESTGPRSRPRPVDELELDESSCARACSSSPGESSSSSNARTAHCSAQHGSWKDGRDRFECRSCECIAVTAHDCTVIRVVRVVGRNGSITAAAPRDAEGTQIRASGPAVRVRRYV